MSNLDVSENDYSDTRPPTSITNDTDNLEWLDELMAEHTMGYMVTDRYNTEPFARFEQFKQTIATKLAEERDKPFALCMSLMKDTFRRLWMYEVLFGGIKDMDGRDITKEFEEYQKLEPTRKQFADWYEAKIATLTNDKEDV
jgi:hypothetical protein